MTKPWIRSRAALAMMMVLFAWSRLAHADFVAIGPDWRYSGDEEAPTRSQVDQVLYDGAWAQAVRLSVAPPASGAKAASEATQAFQATFSDRPTMVFKARFTAKGNVAPALTVRLRGSALDEARTFKPSDAQEPAKNDFLQFRWEFQSGRPIPPTQRLESIALIPEVGALHKGDELKVELIDMAFENARPGRTNVHPPVAPAAWVRTAEVSYRDIPVKGWAAESAETAPSVTIEEGNTVVLNGKSLPALRLRFRAGKKATTIALPLKANIDAENVLTFKARVQPPPGSRQLLNVEAPLTGWDSNQFNSWTDNFGVGFRDLESFNWTAHGVPTTHFLQHLDKSQPEVDGFRTFQWDIKNENRTGNKGFDLENPSHLQIFYDNRTLAEGQETVISIVQPQLVTGLAKTDGDMEAYERFRREMAAYKPDYSDSEPELGPPASGRLAKPLPLVKDGRPLGEIVGSPSVWNAEGNGVRELYQWLFRITGGTQLPIVASASDADNVKIFVGAEYARPLFAADLETLKGSDGAAIRTRGKQVYIFGATPKGTLNAVYTFLEGNTDIIWPRPSRTFEAVYSEKRSLEVRWGDYLHRAPARNWGWMGRTAGPQFDYQVRNRANYLGLRSSTDFKHWGLYAEEGGGHNLHTWIPFALFATHPEYWCLIKGKRQHPNGYLNQICLTNPDGRRILMERLRATIDRFPEAREANCYNLKIEDNWGVCECEECSRPIRLPDGTLLRSDHIAFRSTQFFMFLNSVANYLHNRGLPHLQIGTYVYFFTVPVPRVPVTSYVRPYLCDYVRKDHKVPIYAPMNSVWWRSINDWTTVSDSVVMREYTGIYVKFRPLADVAAYDIRALLAAGVKEFTSERLGEDASESPAHDVPSMDAAAMEFWVITRLYWDPNADVQKLRKYYIRRTYREAAPHIEKFYGVLRELYYGEKRTSDFEENHELLRRAVRKGRDAELRRSLDRALSAVKHPVSRMMIKNLSVQYDTWMKEVDANPY